MNSEWHSDIEGSSDVGRGRDGVKRFNVELSGIKTYCVDSCVSVMC